MVTSSGELHGLVDIRTNSVEFDGFKHMNPEIKAKVEKQKKEDDKLVKVKYFNKMGNQERLDKPYCRYAGDPIKIYHLIPGYVYEVPMGLINEVNGIKTPKRSGLVSEDGVALNKDESPLTKDQYSDGHHMLYPATF
jgi:hypothetical protein